MIRILVDSSSDYLLEELNEKGIELIPISITIGEKDYVDGVNLDRNSFYKILEETGDFPKTSQPSPQAFLDIFRDARDKGDDLIYIALSSELSGTLQSAQLAKNMVDYDRIYIIDSLTATYNIKVMADHALKLRDEGKTAVQIIETLEGLKSKVKVIAALDTLEYLSRGGRISKTVAAIGNAANIKPIITVSEEGTIAEIGKCMGRLKAISFVMKHLEAFTISKNFPVYVIYSYGKENSDKFYEKLIQEGYEIADYLQIGPTIGTHIGPEAFGIIFVTD